MRRARLPGSFASHHILALDSLEFAKVQSERLSRDVAIDCEFRHAGLHAGLHTVDAVHRLISAPGLVHVRNFAETDELVEGHRLIQVRYHATVERDADDLAFVGSEELRRGARGWPDSYAGKSERQCAGCCHDAKRRELRRPECAHDSPLK